MSLENFPSFLLNFSGGDMNGESGHFYEFKSFRLNLAERQLLNYKMLVPLTPKAFDVLALLVERAGHLVEKEELMQRVWPDSFVEEANVSRIVHTLRKTLGEDQNGNKFIETVAKKGYRFIADVTMVNKGELRHADANIPAAKTSAPEVVVKPVLRAWHRYWSKTVLVSLTAGIILAAAAGSYFLFLKSIPASGDGRRTIAVLPFVNATDDARLNYLVDGITENVINQLSRLSGLKVASRNAVFVYKGKETELKKIANELGVDAIIVGDIKQLGNQMIINVNLVDPGDGSQIWGKQFIKNSLDAVATPTEISQAVAQNLRVNLTDGDRRSLGKLVTENQEAFQLYLKGQSFAQQNTPDSLNKSIELYQQAIDKDPNFAVAYSDMGMRYVNLGIYFMPPIEVMPKARQAAEKALAIDNTLSDPHTILGLVALLYDWDWDKAKTELTEGSMVNLKSIETFNCSAHLLQMTGRAVDADGSLRSALKNEPLSISLATELACNSYYARRYDESINEYREALIIEPHNFMAIYGMTRTLNYKKQYQEAIDEIEKARAFMPMFPPIAVAEESYALAKMGKREEAEAALKILDEQSIHIFVDPFFMATVNLGLDDREQTFAWLEKAYVAKSSLMPTLINDVKWDDLRNDLRFHNLISRIGVTEEKLAQNQ